MTTWISDGNVRPGDLDTFFTRLVIGLRTVDVFGFGPEVVVTGFLVATTLAVDIGI